MTIHHHTSMTLPVERFTMQIPRPDHIQENENKIGEDDDADGADDDAGDDGDNDAADDGEICELALMVLAMMLVMVAVM